MIRIKLILIFFFSGASALLFQSVWFQLTSIVFGNSVWGITAVTAAFMAGIAIGNILTVRFFNQIASYRNLYCIVELFIGSLGMAVVVLLPHLTDLLHGFLQESSGSFLFINFLRFTVSFILLVLPSTAMGMTLPILARLISLDQSNFGETLGRLYGWNTIGAVFGVLIGELALVKLFGLQNSGGIALLMNLLVIGLTLNAFSESNYPRPLSDEMTKGEKSTFILPLTLSACAGFLMLSLEVIWFRFLLLFHSGTSLIFSIMLAVILFNIGLGGLIAGVFCRLQLNAYNFLPYLFSASGLLVVFTYNYFYFISDYYHTTNVSTFDFLTGAVFLMGPVSLLSSMVFVFLGHFIYGRVNNSLVSTGYLTFFNTLGAASGSLVAGLFLLPVLGIEKSLFVVSIGYSLLGLIYVLRSPHKRTFLKLVVSGSSLAGIIALFPFQLMENRYVNFSNRAYKDHDLVEFREGLTESAFYYKVEKYSKPHYFRLVTNSFSMSATNAYCLRYMKLFAYLPYTLQPSMKDALLISYGVGTTAKALTDIEQLDTIDIVDTSKDILEMSSHVYDINENPLNDPRVKVHLEDGRFFLATTDRKYDLITSEPPPPKNSGISNLYSTEYFQEIKDHLSDHGIVSYWLPNHGLQESDSLAITKAFCDVFQNCSLWSGAGLDWILIGSNQSIIRPEIKNPQELDGLIDQTLKPRLREIGIEHLGQLGSLFLAGPEYLHHLTKNTLPVSDNYPKRISSDVIYYAPYTSLYADLLNSEHAYSRFINSPYYSIFNTTDAKMAEFFRVQEIYNNLVLKNYRPEGYNFWSDLHEMIQDTDQVTIILWLLGSDWKLQEIINEIKDSSPIKIELSKYYVATRNFKRAQVYLEEYAESVSWRLKLPELYLYLMLLGINGEHQRAYGIIAQALSQSSAPNGFEQYTLWFENIFTQ